uniref:Uncharacterized protein n=1 Tax=Desulfomonile tiedjei TaxID=2358 RepID=A0A7C4EWS7_9BACT
MKNAHNCPTTPDSGVIPMKRFVYFLFMAMLLAAALSFIDVSCADEAMSGRRQCPESARSKPECALDITCLDQPVRLGNRAGVCLRADCAGVVAVLHQRSDEASFRRRFFSYRHFAFEGQFVLKDRGVLESGPVRARELFFVLPGDVIEFKIDGEDCLAKIDIQSLGYVKKGSLCELQRWLAEKTFMEMPNRDSRAGTPSASMGAAAQEACQVPGAISLFNETGIFDGLAGLFKRLNVHP